MRKAFLFVYFLLLCSYTVIAQVNNEATILYESDVMKVSKSLPEGVKLLRGNVVLSQKDVQVFCDSAYMSDKTNSFDGYGNVKVLKGDSISIIGKYLRFNGNTRYAQLRDSVVMTDSSTTLFTDSLDYNVKENFGYFFEGGIIKDSSATLVSREGYYFPNDSLYSFKDSVEVRSEKYTIYTDTLQYNYSSEKTFFFGPTHIISEENLIYCENGWYDVAHDIAQFNENAYYKSKENTLLGDSLFYDRQNGIGKAFRNVQLIDSIDNALVFGEKVFYDEKSEFSIVTEKALFVLISEENDSLFVHADTLLTQKDSSGLHKEIIAFRHTKIFRHDMQSACDSMYYTFSDSIIKMFGKPVMWHDVNQVSANYIELHTKDNKPDSMLLQGTSMVVSKQDTIGYNQIRGKNMIGYFDESGLRRIDVNGNGQTIYYPMDDGELIGINKSECSNMILFLENKKMRKIVLLNKPVSTLNPPGSLSAKDLFLDDFEWRNYNRPLKRDDVFVWKNN